MERTKKIEKRDSGQIRWQNQGGGTLKLGNGKIIKPGDIFRAYPHEVSQAFRDTIIPIDGLTPTEEIKGVPVVYTLQRRNTSQWYDVLDAQGKRVNTKALNEEEAVELKKSLEG